MAITFSGKHDIRGKVSAAVSAAGAPAGFGLTVSSTGIPSSGNPIFTFFGLTAVKKLAIYIEASVTTGGTYSPSIPGPPPTGWSVLFPQWQVTSTAYMSAIYKLVDSADNGTSITNWINTSGSASSEDFLFLVEKDNGQSITAIDTGQGGGFLDGGLFGATNPIPTNTSWSAFSPGAGLGATLFLQNSYSPTISTASGTFSGSPALLGDSLSKHAIRWAKYSSTATPSSQTVQYTGASSYDGATWGGWLCIT